MTAAAPGGRRLVEVAVPLPLFRSYTYDASGDTGHPLVAGSRVLVPVRNTRVMGICLGESDGAALGDATPKRVLGVPDAEPAFRPDLLNVCRWISDYYVAPLGMVLRAALPSALGVSKRPEPAVKARRVLTLATRLPSLLERDRTFARSPQQRALYELLESLGGQVSVDQLVTQLGCSAGVVQALAKRGLARIEHETIARDPFKTRPAPLPTPHDPTPAHSGVPRHLIGSSHGSPP